MSCLFSEKKLNMNMRQQAASIKATQKSQQEANKALLKYQKEQDDNKFKRDARFRALDAAESIYRTEAIGTNKSVSKKTGNDVTKEAEKIYQWLIKVIK